jgi:hypothetical protein
VKAKLANPAAIGQPEDQLRAPLETLVKDLAEAIGQPAGVTQLVGETTYAETGSRPDYSVTVSNALTGFIELKAPGKGADPRNFKDDHDKVQWAKFQRLPTLLHTDGNAHSLWRDGARQGDRQAGRRCGGGGREARCAGGDAAGSHARSYVGGLNFRRIDRASSLARP